MRSINLLRATCIVGSLVLLLAACAPAAGPSTGAATARPSAGGLSPTPSVPPTPTAIQPKAGGVLTVVAIADPPTFDIQQEATANVSMLLAPAYNNLLYYDTATGSKIVPELADQWSVSPDGLSYTFRIRKDVRFHDETPLTVEDIVFSLERLVRPPKGIRSGVAFLLTSVTKIEAAGDDSVKVTLKEPFAPFVSTLVIDYMPMYPKRVVESKGDMKRTINGTGPFKFKAYNTGSSMELEKNGVYWVKGRPYLDGITFHIIRDKATRLAALRTGRAMLSSRIFGALSPADMTTLKAEVPGMRFVPSPTVVGTWLFMNMRSAPLKDARVRQAMSMAIDRKAALKVIGEGEGRLGNFFPFDGWGIPPDELLQTPGYRQPKDLDIAEAKKLLAAAGYPDGFTLTLTTRPSEVEKTSTVFVTDQLAKIGITAKVEILESAVFWDRNGKLNFQAYVTTPAGVIADPFIMGRFFAPKGNFNFSGNDDDAKLNELWKKQNSMVDERARKAVITDLERYLLTEQVPAAPIVWPGTFIAIASQVRGFVPGVNDYSNNRYQDTWLASPGGP